MCLDLSHLFEDRSMDMVETYSHGIAIVHLSEVADGRPHGRAGQLCRRALRRLKALGWTGAVVLEYLPDFLDVILLDRESLETAWRNGEL